MQAQVFVSAYDSGKVSTAADALALGRVGIHTDQRDGWTVHTFADGSRAKTCPFDYKPSRVA